MYGHTPNFPHHYRRFQRPDFAERSTTTFTEARSQIPARPKVAVLRLRFSSAQSAPPRNRCQLHLATTATVVQNHCVRVVAENALRRFLQDRRASPCIQFIRQVWVRRQIARSDCRQQSARAPFRMRLIWVIRPELEAEGAQTMCCRLPRRHEPFVVTDHVAGEKVRKALARNEPRFGHARGEY